MKNIYAIRDLKTNYGNPICDMNDESAKRGFMMAVESVSYTHLTLPTIYSV
mgnify:CR=1 FL=1